MRAWVYIVVGALLVITLGLSIFFGYKYYKSRQLLNNINNSLSEAKLEIGRAKSIIGDANVQIKKLNEQIQADIKERQTLLITIGELRAELNSIQPETKIVTRVVYKDKVIPLPEGKIFVKLADGTLESVTSMKFKYSDFRIDIEGDTIKEVISYKLHQRFRAVFAETVRENGTKDHYIEIYELDDKNKDVNKLTIKEFNTIYRNELVPRFHWFNPKIDIQFGFSLGHKATPSWLIDGGISFMSYGVTRDDLSWRFLRLGIGATKDGFALSGAPIAYNVGRKILPQLLSHTWIAPFVGYVFIDQEIIFGIGLSANL